jgi:hypothetical protein
MEPIAIDFNIDQHLDIGDLMKPSSDEDQMLLPPQLHIPLGLLCRMSHSASRSNFEVAGL